MHGGARYEGGRGKRLKSRREAADRRESGGNPGGEVVLLRSLPRLWPKSTLLRYLLELLSTRDGSLNIAEQCNRRSSYNRSHSRGDVFSRMIRKTRVVSSWINKSGEISRSIDRTLSFKSGNFERFRSIRFFDWEFERILWHRFFVETNCCFFVSNCVCSRDENTRNMINSKRCRIYSSRETKVKNGRGWTIWLKKETCLK